MECGAGLGSPRERLGWFFLARLARLVGLRSEWQARLGTPPPGLLEHALASTYADCLQLGLRAEARALLGIVDQRGRSR
jgi:hypothetical protein